MQDAIGLENGRPADGPPCVLVVDDDPGVRLVCTTTLRRAGYDAIEAANAQEGYERAIAERPDLALLDVQMPELDGFGLAAALLEDERTQQLRFVFTGRPGSLHRGASLRGRRARLPGEALRSPRFRPVSESRAGAPRAQEELSRRGPDRDSRLVTAAVVAQPEPVGRGDRLCLVVHAELRQDPLNVG